MSPLRSALASCFLLMAAAGCIGDSGGAASVSFDGTGNGSHEDKAKCDSDATLVSSGQVDQGQVDVYVTDGDGAERFHQQFDGGANLDAKGLDGASGTWTVRALRTSDSLLGAPFSGDYKFSLSC
jgi:hypothetical protein